MDDLYWRIGDGSDVRLWRDKWVKGVEGSLADYVNVPEERKDWRVSDLIQNGRWAVEKLDGLVPAEIIKKIEQVPLTYIQRGDEVVWLGARNGKYVVKNGYHRTKERRRRVNRRASSSIQLPGELWHQVWRVKALPKISHFLWRCLAGAVPVREKRFKRNCSVSGLCPVCEEEVESLEHAIFLCPWVRCVWFGCRLILRIDRGEMSNFGEWWVRNLVEGNLLNENQLAYFVWLIWLIWKERNRLVFEQKIPDPMMVINMANKAVDEFLEARGWITENRSEVQVEEGGVGWTAPEAGTTKISCDGSFIIDMAAIGLICRDEEGRFLWGFAEKVRAESAVVTEVLALKKALCLMREFDRVQTIIEVDCAEVYWCCKKGSADGIDWRGNWEMQDVISTLADVRNVEITLVSRKGNMAADWITVNCNKGVCPIGWVESPSPSLTQILEFDAKVGNHSVNVRDKRLVKEGEVAAPIGDLLPSDEGFGKSGIG